MCGVWPFTWKRFRRHRAVTAVVIIVCSIVAVHLYTSNVNYTLFNPVWSSQTSSALTKGSNFKMRHIVFVKVHKAASTTLMNILVRFGINHNLTIMIPKHKNILSEHNRFDGKDILPPKGRQLYDMLVNHVIFNHTFLAPLFHPDSKYIAILREPFEQTVSAFMYYKHVYPLPYLWKIKGENPVAEYLKNPRRYEPRNALLSFTNNRMSLDLGLRDVWSHNLTRVQSFIRHLKQTFHVILIAEYFDESVVLLKRLLNWDLSDILYLSSNSLKVGHDLKFSPEDRARHEAWAWIDHLVYNHFYGVFWDKVHAQGKDFFREVHTFRRIRFLWRTFCSQKTNRTDFVIVPPSEWNDVFRISAEDCYLASTKEIPLMDKVRMNYYRKHPPTIPIAPPVVFKKLPIAPPVVFKKLPKNSSSKMHIHRLVETMDGKWIKTNATLPHVYSRNMILPKRRLKT